MLVKDTSLLFGSGHTCVAMREVSGGSRDIFGCGVGGLQRRLELHTAALWLAAKVEVRRCGCKREKTK